MSIKIRLERSEQGELSLRATCSKESSHGGRVARTEDVTDLLEVEQIKTIAQILDPIASGIVDGLRKKVVVDEMEQVMSRVKGGDPRLARLSIEGAISVDGKSSQG